MTDTVRYTTGWNNLTNQPAADHDWIDASLARARFEQNEFIDVVESSSISKDGLVYPLDTQRWKLSDSIRTTRITVRPDGAAHFKIRDRTTGEKSLTNLTGFDVSAHWLDIPTFGEWDALTDPGRSATEIAQGS